MRTASHFSMAFALLLAIPSAITAQMPQGAPHLHSVESIPFASDGPVLRQHTEAQKPFTVAGERGVILGQQDGTFEAWLLPLKLISHLTIEANIEGYTVPIDVNAQPGEIEVRPDRTTITYSHIGFTVRQIMFSPEKGPAGTGPVVLYQFDCVRPTEFTLRFTPELRWMWPERNEGVPGVEWVTGPTLKAGDSRAENDKSGVTASGFYVLHSDYPDLAAALAIPGAHAGILAPYQERPQVHPVEFKLRVDPERDRGRLFPLLMAYGPDRQAANTAALGVALQELNDALPRLYSAHAEAWRKLLTSSVSIHTPDKQFNEAFQWAVVSIEQLKAKPWAPKSETPEKGPAIPAGDEKKEALETADETALVAGYYASGDSARPGFGWFFGRDALYTLYAVNGFGDFALSKSELEFLIRRQRADGKIMHEYSQTAAAIDWAQFPYEYAAADSTPLFLMAMLDYVRASGDVAFVKENRDAIRKAWAFETGHADSNGIYTNEQGTGWVESWPGGMPHQEIYLALLDQQASAAMAELERLLGNNSASNEAKARAEKIAATINEQFGNGDKGCYAFSRNKDGSLDRTQTVYPALAWWSGVAMLAHGEECLRQFASAALDTDWGLRDLSNQEKIYDGMSYHQGSVWPLFTGWAALAEYRGNQPLAGYQMLKQNASLTYSQDIGAITELLSGDYFVPFGRSTSHQLWSSAMVVTPTLRGLFGISVDAEKKEITVNPHLPAGWTSAHVDDLQLPDGDSTRLDFVRKGDRINVFINSLSQGVEEHWKLRSDIAGATIEYPHGQVERKAGKRPTPMLSVPTPLVEIDPAESGGETPGDTWPGEAPLGGDRTKAPRVVRSQYSDGKLVLELQAPGGTSEDMRVLIHGNRHLDIKPIASNGTASWPLSQAHACAPAYECNWMPLTVHFPEGQGWKTTTVTLTW